MNANDGELGGAVNPVPFGSKGSNPFSPIFWNVAEWIKAASGVATHGLTLSPGASWVRIPPFQTNHGGMAE